MIKSLASGLRKFISGRATTEVPRPGQERGRFVVRFTDVFDQVSIDRVNHSSKCGYCRTPWTTLQFRTAFALDHAWSGLVAEFLKFLASTTVQSKFINPLNTGYSIHLSKYIYFKFSQMVWQS